MAYLRRGRSGRNVESSIGEPWTVSRDESQDEAVKFEVSKIHTEDKIKNIK